MEAVSHVAVMQKVKLQVEVQQAMRLVMEGVLIEHEAMYLGSESVELLESVAIGMHHDANPNMSFAQLEALCLTPLGGIFDL